MNFLNIFHFSLTYLVYLCIILLGMKVSKDLTAAAAVPLLLTILSRQESYGYDMIRKVRELSGNRWEWTEGMLYPILHRMEKQGWTESFWRDTPAGRKRKYYRICEKGLTALADLENQWELIGATMAAARKWEINRDE